MLLIAAPGTCTAVETLASVGVNVKVFEIVCADILVAKFPPVTAWLGTPLPVTLRVVPHPHV
jgi:hypothetical protein